MTRKKGSICIHLLVGCDDLGIISVQPSLEDGDFIFGGLLGWRDFLFHTSDQIGSGT
jgi:hypothetical protein